MNMIKSTLALTLSTLALTFAGSAIAGPSSDKQGREFNKQRINKHQVVTQTKRYVKPGKTVVVNKKRVVNNKRVLNQKRIVNKKMLQTRGPFKTVTVKYPNKRKIVKRVTQPRFANNKSRYANKHGNKSYVKYNKPRISNNRFHNRNATVYRINRGDTLYRISLKTGVSLKRLVRLNSLYGNKINRLKAGQFLRLV